MKQESSTESYKKTVGHCSTYTDVGKVLGEGKTSVWQMLIGWDGHDFSLFQSPRTSSIILTTVTAAFPGSAAGAQSCSAGGNMLICQHPPLNNPIQMIHSATWPGDMTNPTSHPSPDKTLHRYSNQALWTASGYRLHPATGRPGSGEQGGGDCHLT